MGGESAQSLFRQEELVRQQAVREHKREILLFVNLLNVYIEGFNQIGSFTPTDENETQWVWMLMMNRSFHTYRCAIDLIQKSYYSEAVTLIRRSTEDWFVCGNCIIDPRVNKAILDKRGGITLPNYKTLAKNMKAELVYEQDYKYSCQFTHGTTTSLAVLLDKADRELSIAPHYDRTLFLSCCELLFRSSLRMGQILAELLNGLSPEKAGDWWRTAESKLSSITEWLKEAQHQYSSN